MLFNFTLIPSHANEFSRVPSNDRIWLNRFGYHSARCHDSSPPYSHARQNDCPRPNPDIIFYNHARVILWPFFAVIYAEHVTTYHINSVISSANSHLRTKHHITTDDDRGATCNKHRTITKIYIIAN